MSENRAHWTGWLPIIISLETILVAVVVWLLTALAGKADAGAVHQLQMARARAEERERWTDATLYQIALKVGVVVPPPPNPSP